MIYGSVCSGIEAASCAWHPLGWKAAWFSEIDTFPSAVLAHHYPDVPNLGDMTKLHEREEFSRGAIDLLVGGTPCQSFSVAGLRKGMADPRGNLALVFLSIVDRARPAWVVWENVPGVLSSNGGRDFGAFLGGLGQLGYGFAYRVLDAQFYGVAQRRRRVFVVGYLGDWRPAAAVLFERASLSGHPPPRRKAREGVAPTLAARTKGGGGLGTDFDCDGGLIAECTQVRRLTPTECERLMGFPDGWTAIPYRGKPADGPRYKALGNSMAVPVIRWIGRRIEMVEAMDMAYARYKNGVSDVYVYSCGCGEAPEAPEAPEPREHFGVNRDHPLTRDQAISMLRKIRDEGGLVPQGALDRLLSGE